jgi:hypothetical protein
LIIVERPEPSEMTLTVASPSGRDATNADAGMLLDILSLLLSPRRRAGAAPAYGIPAWLSPPF